LSQLDVGQLPEHLVKVDLENTTNVWHIPAWGSMADPRRLAFIRKLVEMRGKDPRISALAVDIFRKAGAKPRDFKAQAAALLAWVQDPANCYFHAESGEILTDPIAMLRLKHGDCDDSVAMLTCLFASQRFNWRFCLAGVQGGKKVKGADGKTRRIGGKKIVYIEGSKYPKDCEWSHIFAVVSEPFTAKTWYFCETTLPVPLGWHILSTDPKDKKWLPPPEVGGAGKGPARIVPPPPPPLGFRPSKLPPKERRSPAYDFFYLKPEADDLSGGWSFPGPRAALQQAPRYEGTSGLLPSSVGIVRFNPSTPADFGDGAYSGSALSPIGVGIGIGTAAEVDAEIAGGGTSTTAKKLLDFEKMIPGIVTGVAIAVSTQLLLDWIRPKFRTKKALAAEKT